MSSEDSNKFLCRIPSPFQLGEDVEVDVLPSSDPCQVTVRLTGVTSGGKVLLGLDTLDLTFKGGAAVS